MKLRIGLFLLAIIWADILFPWPAQSASRPNYIIAFIPVNWGGNQADFEVKARRQGEFFVAKSGINNYANVEFVFLKKRMNVVSLNDPWLVEEIVAFGLAHQPADRYIGLTDGDLTSGGSHSVVGWTRGPDSLGIMAEAVGVEISAHELGHTFALCDEYLYKYWKEQNDAWICPNPFPSNCSRADGNFCAGTFALDGNYSIMGPDGLPGEYSYNQPSWYHLQSAFATLFSTTRPNPAQITPTPAAPPAPTPAPIAQTLALVNPILVSMEPDGTTKKLVSEPVLHPAWSLDGTWIAYSAAREGALDLYRIPALGGMAQRLTGLPGRETHPVWLPDGDHLIFASDVDGVTALYLLDILSNTIQLISGLPQPASWPAVSPDGRKLAFSAAPGNDWELYTIDLNADSQPVPGTLTRLTSSTGSDISPAWNLDGTALVFASSRSGSLDLYLLTLNDLSITSLTNSPANEWAPQWLEDGHIVYQAYDGASLALWVLDPKSGSSQVLTLGWNEVAWPAPKP